jgi:1-phosphofructokinase family hexose kinase
MIYTLTLNPAVDLEYRVEHIHMGEIHRATSSRADWGGKGFNVSRALKVLGQESVAVGFAGGPTGKSLEQGLRGSGIATDLVWIAGETRTNVSVVGEGRDESFKVNQAGPAISGEDVAAILSRLRDLTRAGDLWVLSGRLPPGVGADFYARALILIHAAGGKAILDTSGAALEAGIAEKPFLVKPNAEEAAELTGQAVETQEEAVKAARSILRMGPGQVVLSMGAQGAVGVQGNRAWYARPLQIRLSNPVGAGDALVAGLAAGIVRGWDLPQTLKLGIACGASAASQPGTGIGSLAEIETMARAVFVEAIAAG